MPLLASFMSVLFGAAFSFLGRYFVAEKAARIAAWAVCFAALTALIALAYSVIAGPIASGIANISSAHPSIGMGLGIAWNSVTLAAAGSYMTVWIACQVYVLKKKAVNVILGG